MSNATELAELEAAIADRELTDEEAEFVKALVAEGMATAEAIAATLAEREALEAVSEPEIPAGVAIGEPTERQLRELERETDRHLAKAAAIMGEHLSGFEPCDHCGGIGLAPPGPRPQAHDYFKACETCAGFGQVKTGSLRGGNEARDCPTCKGRGYLEALDADGRPLAEAPTPAPFVSAPAAPPAAAYQEGNGATAPAAPTFGTPAWMGDPNLGR